MRIRCDGEQTRRRIMDAACHVFSEKGFRDATHEMICGKAEANKAAINYHFGDKQSLYRAVWQHLLDAADREHPVSGNLPEDRGPAERFESHIRALLNRHFGEGSSRQLERLRSLERVNPTGLVDDILSAHHARNRRANVERAERIARGRGIGPGDTVLRNERAGTLSWRLVGFARSEIGCPGRTHDRRQENQLAGGANRSIRACGDRDESPLEGREFRDHVKERLQ